MQVVHCRGVVPVCGERKEKRERFTAGAMTPGKQLSTASH